MGMAQGPGEELAPRGRTVYSDAELVKAEGRLLTALSAQQPHGRPPGVSPLPRDPHPTTLRPLPPPKLSSARRRSALRPPFATETFQRPRPLRDSAAAGRGRPGGGARLLRGAGPSSAAARPGFGCRPEGGSERGRARGATTSCAVRGEISVRVEEIISY